MTNKNIIRHLAQIMINYSGYPHDKVTEQNRQAVEKRLQNCLHGVDGKLLLVLPAFPFKSVNRKDKVLGALPDMGEEVALQKLAALCRDLNAHVQTQLLIVSDGHVFNDLDGIQNEEVDVYFDHLQRMNMSQYISFRRLDDFLHHNLIDKAPVDVLRQKLLCEFAENAEDIAQKDLALYCGMKKFVSQEQPRSAGESRGQFSNRCGLLAREFYRRSQAYSKMIDCHLPQAFRLSIHPRDDWSEKLPVQLVAPDHDLWATPWHNVLVCNDTGQNTLMHRRQAEERGYKLEYKNGRPWNYRR